MSIKVSIGGVFKTVAVAYANVFKVRVGGAWKDVSRVFVYKTYGTPPLIGWRVAWQRDPPPGPPPPPPPPAPPPSPPPPPPPPPAVLSVSVTPSPIGRTVRNGSGTITTGTATATASGGTGPYTYHWEILDWTSSTQPVITSPNAAASTFSQDNMLTDDNQTATVRVTAVDSLNNFGSTNLSVSWTTYEWDRNYDRTLGGNV